MTDHPDTPRGARGGRARTLIAGTLAGILALTFLALIAACGGDTAPPPDTSTTGSSAPADSPSGGALTAAEEEWLAEKGALQVGAFSDYPPFAFVDEDGAPAGMAVDYWDLLAERLGVEIVVTPVLFDEQLEGLKDGRFDTLQGIFPLPEREQWFAFSQPYFTIDTRIFVAAGHDDVTTLEGLEGLKVAVVKGDSGQQIADDAGLTTLVVEGYPEAVKAVASGAAQAMILDEMVADYYINEFDLADSVKAAGGDPVASGDMTLPVRKDDTVLLGILDKGISMVGDSEFEGIYERWTSR
ncbi:MAG: transporter substrate-binding domain-containing protein [Actinobacteria bacterium]|nr:transporter substrate-binding domain-containing protein [Actinomycetota bacterium]